MMDSLITTYRANVMMAALAHRVAGKLAQYLARPAFSDADRFSLHAEHNGHHDVIGVYMWDARNGYKVSVDCGFECIEKDALAVIDAVLDDMRFDRAVAMQGVMRAHGVKSRVVTATDTGHVIGLRTESGAIFIIPRRPWDPNKDLPATFSNDLKNALCCV